MFQLNLHKGEIIMYQFDDFNFKKIAETLNAPFQKFSIKEVFELYVAEQTEFLRTEQECNDFKQKIIKIVTEICDKRINKIKEQSLTETILAEGFNFLHDRNVSLGNTSPVNMFTFMDQVKTKLKQKNIVVDDDLLFSTFYNSSDLNSASSKEDNVFVVQTRNGVMVINIYHLNYKKSEIRFSKYNKV